MKELTEPEQLELLDELRDALGGELTSFRVDDGVLVVSVETPAGIDLVPPSLFGYPVKVEVRESAKPEICFHGGTDYSISDRQNQKFNPVPIGVQTVMGTGICSSNGILVSSGNHYILTAGHCALDTYPNSYKGAIYHQADPLGGQLIGDDLSSDQVNYDYAFAPLFGGSQDHSISTELLGLESGISHVVRPNVGETITKLGRTTGITSSTVASTGETYRMPLQGTDIFWGGGIRTEDNISDSGDSGGMAVVQRDGEYHPVGILSGGTDNFTLFCSIRDVLDRIGKFMLTGRKVVHPGGSESICDDTPVEELVDGPENMVSIVPDGTGT